MPTLNNLVCLECNTRNGVIVKFSESDTYYFRCDNMDCLAGYRHVFYNCVTRPQESILQIRLFMEQCG